MDSGEEAALPGGATVPGLRPAQEGRPAVSVPGPAASEHRPAESL